MSDVLKERRSARVAGRRAGSAEQTQRNRVMIAFLVTALGVVNVGPILWGLVTSVRPTNEIFRYPPSIVGGVTDEHYLSVLGGSFTRNIVNSLLYAGSATVVALVIAALAAYGFDRFRFPLRGPAFALVVACIPLSMGAAVLVIPNYLYFSMIGLLDTPFTLPLLYLGYNVPMAVWIIKGAMEGIPRELDEAAMLDGASRLRLFRSVLLPLCRPSLAAAGVFVFVGSWNEFLAGSVMVSSGDNRPVQVAVYQFISAFGRQWGPLTASAMLALIPIIILVFFFGRQLVAGLMRGAVKG